MRIRLSIVLATFTVAMISCHKLPDVQDTPELICDGESDIVFSEGGGTSVITFKSNRDWIVDCTETWCYVDPSEGPASESAASIILKCDPNKSFNERRAFITIRQKEGTLSQVITVRQGGRPNEYLTFDIIEGGVISFINHNCSLSVAIEYSCDGGSTWVAKTGGFSLSVSNGDRILFRGRNSKYAEDEDHCYCLCGDKTMQYSIHGNLMSMIVGDDYQKWDSSKSGLDEYAFSYFFANREGMNDSLISASGLILPDIVSAHCFDCMFYGCRRLVDAPDLPATELADYCYYAMFFYTGLVNAPDLPATRMVDGCYAHMFAHCQKLVKAPDLPATSLAKNCYEGMFLGCASLVHAPDLPAKEMAESCYNSMFVSCISLSQAPDLPATILADRCYTGMFDDCRNFDKAPDLPATVLAAHCYEGMFSHCRKMSKAPDLPATNLTYRCYLSMFCGCTSLVKAPELPASKLEEGCYEGMFANCTNLQYVKCLATELTAKEALTEWMWEVSSSGTFVKAPGAVWPAGRSGIPDGWTVIDAE